MEKMIFLGTTKNILKFLDTLKNYFGIFEQSKNFLLFFNFGNFSVTQIVSCFKNVLQSWLLKDFVMLVWISIDLMLLAICW